jgi:hypothetical protein
MIGPGQQPTLQTGADAVPGPVRARATEKGRR